MNILKVSAEVEIVFYFFFSTKIIRLSHRKLFTITSDWSSVLIKRWHDSIIQDHSMGQMWSKIKLKEIGDRMHDFGSCNVLFVDKHSHSLLSHPWSLSGLLSSLALGCSSTPSSHPTNALFPTIKAACIQSSF